MVDPSRPEPCLGQREAGAALAQHVVDRHPHLAQQQLAMTVQRLVVHHRDVAFDGQARAVHRHQHHRVPCVLRRMVAFADPHHNREPARWVRRAGDEPLAAADHPFVAVALDAGLQLGRVGRRSVGLAHCETRPDLAAQQRVQPGLNLGRCRGDLEQLHRAAVGRVAVENFGSPGHPAHDLGQWRIVEIAQPRARLVGAQTGQEQVPKPELTCLRLERLDQVQRVFVGVRPAVPLGHRGQHQIGHELLQFRLQRQRLG